jgi:hypothetical protein
MHQMVFRRDSSNWIWLIGSVCSNAPIAALSGQSMNGISIMTRSSARSKTGKAGRGKNPNPKEKNFFEDPEAVKREANAYGPIVTSRESGELFTASIIYTSLEHANDDEAEQNGCRQRLIWHLSCHRRFPLAVA